MMPYTYNVPEQFLQDSAVPMHWKLYALITTFWNNGRTVFATNAWFVERLGTTDRHIRRCLQRLESLGLVERGWDETRVIYPGGRTPAVRGEELGGPGGEDASRPGSLIYINTKLGAEAPIEIVKDEPKPKAPRKDAAVLEVFRSFGAQYPKNWEMNRNQRGAAQRLLDEHGLPAIKEAIKKYAINRKEKYIPKANTPWKLDEKWVDLHSFFEENDL